MLSPSEQDWRRLERSLANVPLDEWSFFALGSREAPRRIYKLCARCRNGPWKAIIDVPVLMSRDPTEHQKDHLSPPIAVPPECVHAGPLVQLLDLDMTRDEFASAGLTRFQAMVRRIATGE